jgi:hypothetical protein
MIVLRGTSNNIHSVRSYIYETFTVVYAVIIATYLFRYYYLVNYIINLQLDDAIIILIFLDLPLKVN